MNYEHSEGDRGGGRGGKLGRYEDKKRMKGTECGEEGEGNISRE